MTTTATDPNTIAAAIGVAWGWHLERQRRTPAPHPYVYASSWRPCVRRMTYEMVAPDQAVPFPTDVLAKFRRGDDRERDLIADLIRVGRDADPPFNVVNQQERFTLNDRKGRAAIVGKVDARIQVGTVRAPIEVKSWSPFLVDRIDRFDDVFANPWTRSGGYQLLSYLYGANEPYGFLLLDRSGIPALIPVELDQHLDRMEDFLTRAEAALNHMHAGTLPDFLQGDAAECQRCPFYGGICNPPLSHPGTRVIADPELEMMLERRDSLKASARDFDALDKQIKQRLRGVESAIVGPFLITGEWGTTSRVELPDDIKAQYTTKDPRGRFTLDIVKV